MKTESSLQKAFRTARVVHLAIMAAVPVYVLLSLLGLHPVSGGGAGRYGVQLRYAFYAAAVVLILILRQLSGPLGRRIPVFTAAMITAALGEAPAVMGFAYYLLTGIRRDFYFLAGLSIILLLLYFPKAEYWEARESSNRGDIR